MAKAPGGTDRERAKRGAAAKARSSATAAPRARSQDERQNKLNAILDAALEVFSEKGFAEARLDDVARRAGVAKGTLYLYVSSKQALFETLIRSGIAAPIQSMEARILASDAPTRTLLKMLFGFLVEEVLRTKRREIARLILSEAQRFPEIAALYHREVVSRGLSLLRHIAQRAVERGEFRADELVRFPHLVIAPGIVALLWTNLFERLEPLDIEAMLDAHLDVLFRAMEREP